jgi:hypothetical protein
MGASISLDSKYRLILNTEVECISINTSSPKAKAKANASGSGSSGSSGRKHRKDRESDDDDKSGSDKSGSGSGSDSDSDSDKSGSGSGSDSDGEKTYTVKLTPEIIGYIRSYIRKTQFLDEFDLITEIELDKYDHAPGSAIVFNSDSIVFMPNNQTLEAVGEWEYLEPDKPVVSSSSSSSKSKSKSGSGRSRHRHDDDDDEDEDARRDHASSKYKTKDDDLPVGEIENVITDKFQEYNKTREFVIHESKSSFLALLIKSVEVVKV